jgi:hypothetical protein
MEADRDVTTSGPASIRRRRGVLLLVGALVLAGGIIAAALAASNHGGSSSNASANLRAGSGANLGTARGTSPTTVRGSNRSATTKAPPDSRGAGSSIDRSTSPGDSTAPKGSTTPSTPRVTLKPGGLGAHYHYDPTASTIPLPPATPPMVQAYVTSFQTECHKIWSIATSDGKLWDPDEDQPRTPYTVNDCLNQLRPADAKYSFDASDASVAGTSDAIDAAGSLTWFGTLQNTPGTQRWTDPNWSTS